MDSRRGVLEAGIGVVNFQLLLMSQGLLKNRLTIWAIIKLLLQWWTQLTVSVFLSFQFDWWNSSVVVKAFYLLLNLLTVSNMNLNWLVMRNTSTSHMMFITLTPTFSILRSIRTLFVWSPTTTTFVGYYLLLFLNQLLLLLKLTQLFSSVQICSSCSVSRSTYAFSLCSFPAFVRLTCRLRSNRFGKRLIDILLVFM